MRKVKIQCTIGPACNDPQTLGDMLDAGMEVARINLSHGSAASQKDKLENFRAAADARGKLEAAIMYDLRGPEIRVCDLPGGSVKVWKDQTLVLCCEDPRSAGESDGLYSDVLYENAFDSRYGGFADNRIAINYPGLCEEVQTGSQILIDDGKVSMNVESVSDSEIICYVDRGGVIASRKGINVPGVKLQMDYLSDADKEDLLWCIDHGADYIAGSFIRRADDVQAIRDFLDANGGHYIGIIAKIECLEAIQNFEEIAKAADQILIARGDLGVEIGFEKVPAMQKRLIRKSRQLGKAVIIATQLIESMTDHLIPTRAEVSDIANAVFDGATDLLVTGETASGEYPVEVVRTMAKIMEQAEEDMDRYGEALR